MNTYPCRFVKKTPKYVWANDTLLNTAQTGQNNLTINTIPKLYKVLVTRCLYVHMYKNGAYMYKNGYNKGV